MLPLNTEKPRQKLYGQEPGLRPGNSLSGVGQPKPRVGAKLGLLERRAAEDGAEGPWVRYREAPLVPMPPFQFTEGIKKFLFNYFFLENY